MIGIIYGTGLKKESFPGEELKDEEVETTYGKVLILRGENVAIIPRHGLNRTIPPHRIDHLANFMALKKLDVNEVIATSSGGSLSREIKPKSIVVPDDYINLAPSPSLFDTEIKHVTPGIDESLRKIVLRVAKEQGIKVIDKGVYFQTTGPRLETKAEIRMMKNFADIVGMTMASEATVAKEMKMRYASICQIDNYAHGIIPEERIDYEEIVKKAEKTREKLTTLLKAVVKDLESD